MSVANHGEGYSVGDFSSGMIDDQSVSNNLLPKNAVRKGVNVMFDRPVGSVTQRNGTTQLGDTMPAEIEGVYNFRSSTASYNQLLALSGGTVYYLNSSTWINLRSGYDLSKPMRFLTYLDMVVFLNGSQAVCGWSGTGGVETGGGNLDMSNFPITKFGTVLYGRLFVAGNPTNPCRLYGSSIVSAGAISWTSGYKNIEVAPNDGNGNITGLIGNGKVILIFKNRAMYRYDDSAMDFVVNIGSPAHNSIINDDSGITYFFGQGASGIGFYMTTGGYPRKLSRPIQKWIDAINPLYYDDIAAYTDGRKITWSLGGKVTVDGIDYDHACLTYNLADQTWEARNYADTFMCFSPYINASGTMYNVGGDKDGMVQYMDNGTTDNGSAIYSECEFAPVIFGDRGRSKKVDEMLVYATHFQGLRFHMKVDGGEFMPVGSITEREQFMSGLNFRGHTFWPKLTAVNSSTPFQLDGFNFTRWADEGYAGT